MVARLIAFDLDGTLLDGDNRISAYTAAVLERAAQVDDLVLVAASGRGLAAAQHVLGRVPGVSYAICSNGALLYDRSARRARWSRPLASERVRRFYTDVNALLAGACWAWDTAKGIVADAGFRYLATRPGRELDEVVVAPPLDLAGAPSDPIDRRLAPSGRVMRQLLLHPELNCGEVYTRLAGHVSGPLTRSSASFLEITAPRVDKRAALEHLCGLLEISSDDVVAFGDHMNDLSMLRWAGRGIAMCDGYELLRRQIPEHTVAGHDDDGVALTIEELLGL